MKPYPSVLSAVVASALALPSVADFQKSWEEPIPGINARSSSAGDIDGDGDLDILVTHLLNPSVILLNDGNGNFTIDPSATGLTNGGAGELADLDGDGDLDIFIAGDLDPCKVYLNDGSGKFTDTGQLIGSGDQRSSLALADIDGDGDRDAILPSNDSSRDNEVWLNNGSAVFSNSGLSLGFYFTMDVEVLDIDGDSDLDIFFGNNRENSLWTNNGNGTFTETFGIISDPEGPTTFDLEFGFLNADANLDVWVANGSLSLQPDGVWFGNGDGTFTKSAQVFPNNSSLAVALHDIDGDGDTDALVGTFLSHPDEIWLNNGSGIFTLSPFALESAAVRDFVVADLDGDADTDYFFLGSNNPSTVWKTVPGAGVSIVNSGQRLGSFEASCVDHGDFDGDGDLDIVMGNVDGGLHILANDGSNRFNDTGTILYNGQGSGDGAVAVADLDGDNDLDLFDGTFTALIGAVPANRVWFNDGAGNFTPGAATYGAAETHAILAVNIDGDSDIDILVGNRDIFGASGQNLVLINDGSGGFSSNNALGLADTRSLAAAELDGNPGIDVFVGNEGANSVWFGNGAGAFTNSGQSLASNDTQKVLLADFDADNDIDAFCANTTGGNKLWLNDGSGVFSLSPGFIGYGSARDAVALDADDDGDLDIWIGFGDTFGTAPDELWINNGDGEFTLDSSYQSQRTRALAAADFNGDGDTDVFAASADGDHILWARGGQAVTSYAATFGLTGSDTDPLADPDGDGLHNYEEMAFNLNPKVSDNAPISNFATATAGFPTISVEPFGGEKRFVAKTIRLKNPVDITYQLEAGSDLSFTVPSSTVISPSSFSTNYERVIYTFDPLGNPSAAFGRFSVRYTP